MNKIEELDKFEKIGQNEQNWKSDKVIKIEKSLENWKKKLKKHRTKWKKFEKSDKTEINLRNWRIIQNWKIGQNLNKSTKLKNGQNWDLKSKVQNIFLQSYWFWRENSNPKIYQFFGAQLLAQSVDSRVNIDCHLLLIVIPFCSRKFMIVHNSHLLNKSGFPGFSATQKQASMLAISLSLVTFQFCLKNNY